MDLPTAQDFVHVLFEAGLIRQMLARFSEILGILASLHNPKSTSARDEQVEVDGVVVARQIFSSDRRFYEVSKLLQKVQSTTLFIPLTATNNEALTLQKEVAKTIVVRTFTVPLGRSWLFF
ncbi:hypothetical protein LXG23DRAFT_53580 [Yarrowia lipolytica]|nr:hypothetical protein LXG23DRAFT_53580 [Yarrowia lipolytica]